MQLKTTVAAPMAMVKGINYFLKNMCNTYSQLKQTTLKLLI